MSGETKSEVSGWTVDTALAHTKDLINDLAKRHDEHLQSLVVKIGITDVGLREVSAARMEMLNDRFESIKLAITKAETATDRRFESVNDFRKQLTDQATTFMYRVTFEEYQKADQQWRDGMTTRMNQVVTQLSLGEGKEKGSQSTWAIVLAVGSIILALVGTIVAILSKVAA